MLIVRSRKIVPGGGIMEGNPIILFNGISTDIPEGWSAYTPASGVYVMGASGSTVTLPVESTGSYEHSHANSPTLSDGTHNHSGTGNTGTSSYQFGYNQDFAVSGEHSHQASLSITSSGSHTHSVNDGLSVSAKPNSKGLYWIKATTGSSVPPIGAITIWSQSAGLVPVGWAVCDGSGSTVDLRDLFVYGATIDDEVNSSIGGSHTHQNSSLVSDGAHTHGASGTWAGGNSVNTGWASGAAASVFGHKHGTFSVTTSSAGAHQHTVPNTDGATTLPPARILYYIQKIG